jgi:hypothetical protein
MWMVTHFSEELVAVRDKEESVLSGYDAHLYG